MFLFSFICKIDPCFCRIYKMKVHISRHWIRFMPDSCGFIVKSVFSANCITVSTLMMAMKTIMFHLFHYSCRGLENSSIDFDHSSNSISSHPAEPKNYRAFFKICISFLHEIAKIVWRISNNQIDRFRINLFHGSNTILVI